MDFSRASYNEKHHRHQQSSQQVSNPPNRSVSSSSGYNQHPPLETTCSNVLPGFPKSSVLRTANSMYKSNTSLDLDLEVGLVEQAVNNVHIMNAGGARSSNPQYNIHQAPITTTIGIASDRRLPHLAHNSAKMRDFSGSHGSIVDVLSTRNFGNDEVNTFEGSRVINHVQLRFVFLKQPSKNHKYRA